MAMNPGKAAAKPRGRRILTVVSAILAAFVAIGVLGYQRSRSKKYRAYANSDVVRTIVDDTNQGIGNVQVRTLPFAEGAVVTRASYSFSGRVIVSYRDGSDNVICTLDDDGTDVLEVYRGGESLSTRLLPYWDNTRILLGDAILECPEGTTLDTCPAGSAQIVPIEFPAEFTEDAAVMEKWTEVIISPDNEHIAWTILRTDCGAVNAMGTLVRHADAYVIEDASYISNMNSFMPDPNDPILSLYTPEVGGEVKQFVRGGAAISLVGSSSCGMGDSVVQDIATGEVTLVTHAPGYDETTIFSPDERLGITMTTRFSTTTNMGVLDVVDRPYGQVLHNILGQVYLYGVTGVRGNREGNIGPALINIEQSMTEPGYRGLDLSDPEGVWVYNSPMSWRADGTSAMWMERDRDGGHVRVQIVDLLDYEPGQAVEAVATPRVGDYATAPEGLGNYRVVVAGAYSGTATIVKETGFLGRSTVTIAYDGYSDDGERFYQGMETSSASMTAKTTYESDLVVTDANGNRVGGMDVHVVFGPAYGLHTLIDGTTSPILDVDASGGSADYEGVTRDMSTLVP